jgi:hypothetical protein
VTIPFGIFFFLLLIQGVPRFLRRRLIPGPMSSATPGIGLLTRELCPGGWPQEGCLGGWLQEGGST